MPLRQQKEGVRMNRHEKINYIELPAQDLTAIKVFYSQVFAFEFTDYGPEYAAFSNSGLEGGFFKVDQPLASTTQAGSALVVFYGDDLQSTLEKISDAGGAVAKPIFSFPGGRRFHFLDPNGNELAVWSDK